MASTLALFQKIFKEWGHENPTISITADLDVGRGLGVSEILKMKIEYLGEDAGEHQEFSAQLVLERGDGTIGIHQRGFTFDPRGQNPLALISIAFSMFSDVTDKD